VSVLGGVLVLAPSTSPIKWNEVDFQVQEAKKAGETENTS
jgi:hypothetical protein